jgi:protein-tyrosine phosphatase
MMIDIHCHILPGLDDGASSLKQSLKMAKQAVGDGIRTVVATPHTVSSAYSNPIGEIRKQVAILRGILEDMSIPLEICPGSEARLCSRMTDLILTGEITTLNDNGRYILMEFPDHAFPDGYEEEIFHLTLRGIFPIIAHPERNFIFQEKKELIHNLVNAGCLIQLTAMSITGEMGEDAADFSYYLLEHRMAHIIATDAHSAEYRKPILSKAVDIAARVMRDRQAAQDLVILNPQVILSGSPLKRCEPGKPKKSGFIHRW